MPAKDLPVARFNKAVFLAPSEKAKLIWYGHSVVLLRMNSQNILIDPMFGPDASPIAPFTTKRFSSNTLSIIDELPEIDMVLMTHDHYDHLDLASISKLKKKTKHYFTGLGVARHLVHWGIDRNAITELDWWDQESCEGISITYTPTRHFSGRGLTDRAKSLWGGWVINGGEENIYFSGDGGYGNHFKEVGERLGPFDFGMMECGQYSDYWPQVHMHPQESVQAAMDAKVKKGMPVHWSGFALAQHAWTDPVNRFKKAAEEKELAWSNPKLGELFSAHEVRQEDWWEELK